MHRILKVSRITGANESIARGSDKKKKEWDEFEEAVGFTKVAGLISQSVGPLNTYHKNTMKLSIFSLIIYY